MPPSLQLFFYYFFLYIPCAVVVYAPLWRRISIWRTPFCTGGSLFAGRVKRCATNTLRNNGVRVLPLYFFFFLFSPAVLPLCRSATRTLLTLEAMQSVCVRCVTLVRDARMRFHAAVLSPFTVCPRHSPFDDTRDRITRRYV